MIVRARVETILGAAVVAATEQGIVSLGFVGGPGDSCQDPSIEQSTEAHKVSQGSARSRLRQVIALVQSSLDGSAPGVSSGLFGLDLHGSDFQLRAWQELRAIPRGETRTYSEVAAALGRPGAQRAVARACATNPVAVLVPCHRVVCASGDIGGYRWGRWRKQLLLDLESAV